MRDTELRGIVLQEFYNERHGTTPLSFDRIAAATGIEPNVLDSIVSQLDQHGLIKFDVPLGGDGTGRITANGIDVINDVTLSPLPISLHDLGVHGHGSTHVQVGGTENTQLAIDIEKLMAAINGSHATDAEKQEAKSLLQSFLDNLLVKTILSAGTTASGTIITQ